MATLVGPQKYSYDLCRLDDPAEDLRIFKLTLTSSPEIEGQILRLQKGQPYFALSWCWGDARDVPRRTMRISHDNEPYLFEITASLESALKQLRRLRVEYIWIDQICIHQDNFSERNNQVKLMADIYTGATLVYVWLGDANDDEHLEDSRAAFKFMEDNVLDLTNFDKLVQDKKQHEGWNNMVELLKREWFSRRWVVQEIALARDATILCGGHEIKWTDFADAVSLFNDAEAERQTISRAIMRKHEKYQYRPRYFGYVSALGATRLVDTTNDLFRRRADDEKVALLGLERLVCTFTSFNASEPRDTIYAVLAIAKDTMPRTSHANMKEMVASFTERVKEKFIEQLSRKITARQYYVNYDQPISDVFVDFVDFAISQAEESNALDIICRPWAPVPRSNQEDVDTDNNPWRVVYDEEESHRDDKLGKDSLPSWIRSVAHAAYGLEPKSKRMVRKNADTLVGLPGERNYTAAGGIPRKNSLFFVQGITEHSNYPHLNGVHYHSMFAEGFIVDKISVVRDASQSGNIPKGWKTLSRRNAYANEQWKQLPEDYWRTLVADRGRTGNPPRHYPRLINHALESHVGDDTFQTQDAIDHSDCQAAAEVLERVQSVIWNRQLMLTDKKRLGLVPEQAQRGDLIVILYGCSVPVVLRRFTKTAEEVKHEKEKQWTREQKMAARRLFPVLRANLRRKKEAKATADANPASAPEPNVPSHDAPATTNAGDDVFGAPHRTGTEGASSVDGTNPDTDTEHERQEPPFKHATHSTTHVERQQHVPGAWPSNPSPPVSRSSTHIVAPGPVFPKKIPKVRQSTIKPASTVQASQSNQTPSSTNRRTSNDQASEDAQPAELPLKADEFSFYQLIGECYLHGMMNGEAIPMQGSAEDEVKQRTAEEKKRLARLRDVQNKHVGSPSREMNKEIQRAYTEPVESLAETELAPKPRHGEEPGLFVRTLFELR